MSIRATGLSRSYLDHTGTKEYVFQNVDFEAKAGELTLVMGPSGSGKSTLLNLLALIDPVTKGEVFYFDKAVHHLSEHQRSNFRAQRIGFIFQNFSLISEFSVLDNVAIPLVLAGSSWKHARDKASLVIERLVPGINVKKHPAELSGGQQQRIAIARALVHKPAVLIADEPTGNLDDENAELVWRSVSDLIKAEDMIGIVVTHDERLVEKADRLYRFHMEDSNRLVLENG